MEDIAGILSRLIRHFPRPHRFDQASRRCVAIGRLPIGRLYAGPTSVVSRAMVVVLIGHGVFTGMVPGTVSVSATAEQPGVPGGDSPDDLAAIAARLLGHPRPVADDPSFGPELIRTARAVGRSGDLETAVELLSVAVEHYQSGRIDEHQAAMMTARLGIASAGWQLARYDLVIEHAAGLLATPETVGDANQRVAAGQLLAKALHQTGRYEESLAAARRLSETSPVAKSLATEQAMAIGGSALRAGQHAVAIDAYHFYLTEMPGGGRSGDAALGLAWAAASGAEDPERAERRLSKFIADYPDHRDIPHAIAAQAKLLDQLGKGDLAAQCRLRVLAEHGQSDASIAVLDESVLATEAPWPDAVRAGWLDRLDRITRPRPNRGTDAVPRPAIRTDVMERLFVGSLAQSDDAFWRATLAALLAFDDDGTRTSEVLDRMADAGHVAEHLAIDLLGQMVDHQGNGATAGPAGGAIPAGCESACRWLGSTGRWSMLAIVVDQSVSPDSAKPETLSRGVAIDRLLAESLMQTRRGQDAMLWWAAIIDTWQCDDFPTLIRGAETSVAYGDIDSAQRRLQAAQAAAGDDAFRSSLVRMLEAELAIRRARMDEARDLLAGIVRAGDTVAELRPRAQWMIGETYFLQQKYNEAIDAYRRVDALDAEGEWAAAALLQAGKSFEKLSRSREAATCYTALLSRFANLPHANQARTRLAQLSGEPSLRR